MIKKISFIANWIKENVIFNHHLYCLLIIAFSMILVTPLYVVMRDVFNKITIIWGALLLVRDFFSERKILKNTGTIFVLLYFVFYSGTLIINMENNLYSNVSNCIADVILILGFYTVFQGSDVYSELKRINFMIVQISCIISIASLIKGFFLISEKWYGYIQGVYLPNGRLWGVAANPNGLAVLTFIAIIAAIINIHLNGKWIKKVFYMFSIIINLWVMAMTDARTLKYAMVIFIIIYASWICKSQIENHGMNKLVSFFAGVIISLIVVAVYLSAYTAIQNTSSKCIAYLNKDKLIISETTNQNECENEKKPEGSNGEVEGANGEVEGDTSQGDNNSATEMIEVIVGRENNELFENKLQTDMFTHRIDLWSNGLSILQESPLFGTGQANIAMNMKKLPDNKGLINGDLHNGYLQILVSNGVLGFFAIAGFGILWIIKLIRGYFMKPPQGERVKYEIKIIITAFTFAFFAINLMESSILSSLSFKTFMLWFYLGTYANLDENKTFSIKKLINRRV